MNTLPVDSPELELSQCHLEGSASLAIEEACRRIPPLWPLKDFVAVNPFLGLADLHFLQAAVLLGRTAHAEIMMPSKYYLERLDSGEITDADICEAVAVARLNLPPPWSAFLQEHDTQSLRKELSKTEKRREASWVLSVADHIDRKGSTSWAPFFTDEISKWCSVYYDEGQSSWRMPWRDHSLFQAWREAARHDANPRLSGLTTFDQVVRELPDDPRATIAKALFILGIPVGLQADFLHRQLLSISGWSAYVQYRARQDQMQNRTNRALMELLAMRLAYDWALWDQFKSAPGIESGWREKVVAMQQFDPRLDLLPRYLMLSASEKSYQRRLAARLQDNSKERKASTARPTVQAVFCIDVRSEVFRRHLEAQDERIKTSGFAGFFGMPIEYVPMGRRHGSAQCPVLFTPKFKVREGLPNDDAKATEAMLRRQLFGYRINHAWNAFKTSAISCFSFVETAGLWFGYKLGRDALSLGRRVDQQQAAHKGPLLECKRGHSHESHFGLTVGERIDLAEGALRNLGLTCDFPRLVLFCGHGSTTANNPYASSLDCGACGGHSGLVNARVAAGILNHADVRLALKSRGIEIPADTHFLAGQHNTTTDDLELVEDEPLPPSHRDDLARLREWLRSTSRLARLERAESLGLNSKDTLIEESIRMRSRDWAQVRPEWGLANNATLIAAPRARTRSVKLDGRTFLHDYDASTDSAGKVLELILTAPVVVANWINLQYYASTVNNRLFGSGNKTIHNVVGALGIWQGNGGDLQVGLPLQSLHNGRKWMHEPLRLSVFVESPREAINEVLTAHLEVLELVQNGWLTLFSLEPRSKEIWQFIGNRQWRKDGQSKTLVELGLLELFN